MAPPALKKQAAVTTGSAGSSGIPCTTVLTVFFALSLGTGLSCPIIGETSRQLDTSVGVSGPRDFSVRVRISRPRKICALTCRVHRIPPSTFVTIAKRPSCESGTRGMMPLIWDDVKFVSENQN
jgi:hypothetical protein